MKTSMIMMWIIFLIANIIAFVYVCGVFEFDAKASSFRETENGTQKPLYQSHARLLALATVITGASMCIYRLLTGVRTRAVKLIHSVFHCAALVCIIMGMVAIWRVKLLYEPHQDFFRVTHAYVGFPTLVCHVVLFLCGFFSFYVFNEQCTRQCLAAAHNFLGLCVFLFFVVSNISGLCYRTYSSDSPTDEGKVVQMGGQLLLIPLYVYSILVIIMILCPQFEWELEGDI